MTQKITGLLIALSIFISPVFAHAQTWCGDADLEFHVVKIGAGYGVVSSKSGLTEYRIPKGKEKTLLPYISDGNTGIHYRLDFVLSADGSTLIMLYNSGNGEFLQKCEI